MLQRMFPGGRPFGKGGGNTAPRILVVRNDGLGDFILTLPLIASLKQQLPESRISVLVNESILPLIPLLPDIEGALGDEGVLLKRHRGRFSREARLAGREALRQRIEEERFDAVLLPYAEGSTARLMQRAKIPLRAGPLRRAFFWRFNAHFRSSRKGSGKPEYLLNLGYLNCLGLEAGFRLPSLRLPVSSTMQRGGAGKEGYAVLHPYKRSGTALTWPIERFALLSETLAGAGWAVVVVGDGEDRAVLEAGFSGRPGVRLEIGRPLPELLELIAGARVFVGNSSGPLHLAGLAGIPHVGFYPQDRVSSPERWRTLPGEGSPSDFRRYLLASRFPRGCVVCDNERCPYFSCVASIEPDQVWAAMEAWGLSLAGKDPTESSRKAT